MSSSSASASSRVCASAQWASSTATITGCLRRERLEPADVGAVDGVAGRSGRGLDAQSQQRGQGSEDVVELVAEERAETGPRLRPDRDLGLADLGSEPVEQDLDEGPTRQAAVGMAVPAEPDDAVRDDRRDLLQQPCLPHARLADEEDDAASAGGEIVDDGA